MEKVKRLGKSKKSPPIILNEHIEYIRKRYIEDKASQCLIAKELDISPQKVAGLMKENGIQIRTDREQALKYTFNERYFQNIDTEEKAYWLGFLYADGYLAYNGKNNLSTIGIALSDCDSGHLFKFKKALEFTGKISHYSPSNSNFEGSGDYCRIHLSSPLMAQDLIDKGCVEHKSNILKYPTENQVPIELQHHFIRGYIDGDGSIRFYKREPYAPSISISITSTKEMCLGIQSFFGYPNLKLYSRKNNGKNNYTSTIGGNVKVIRILNILYSNATVYLDRKYKKYLETINYYSSFNSRASQ